MVVGFCFGAFFFLLIVIIMLKFPFQYLLKVVSMRECGLYCGLIPCTPLSWRCLALCKLHRLILEELSTHLEILFVFFLIRLMSLVPLKVLISFSILLSKRLVSFCLLLSSVLFWFVQPSEYCQPQILTVC